MCLFQLMMNGAKMSSSIQEISFPLLMSSLILNLDAYSVLQLKLKTEALTAFRGSEMKVGESLTLQSLYSCAHSCL